MAYHQRAAELKCVDQGSQGVGLSAQCRRGARRPHRIAGTRPIHRHHPILFGEFIDDTVGEVAELAREPVHQREQPVPARVPRHASGSQGGRRNGRSGGSVASTWRAVRAVKSISEPAMAAMAATTRRKIIITSARCSATTARVTYPHRKLCGNSIQSRICNRWSARKSL